MAWKTSVKCLAFIAFAGLTCFPPSIAEATITYRTVATTGQAAPGGGEDSVFSVLYGPTINRSGHVAFKANISGPGVDSTNQIGVWSEGKGSLGLIARTGFTAPGMATDVVFTNLSPDPPLLNEAGQTAFVGLLRGPGITGSNNIGIWKETQGILGLVARTGDVAQDTEADTVFRKFDNLVMNRHGQLVFRGTLTGPNALSGNNLGFWINDSGSTRIVVRSSDPAPDTDAAYGSLDQILINDNGQMAFQSTLTGPTIDSDNNLAIWYGDADQLNLTVRTSDLIPDVDGELYFNLRAPTLNSQGQIAFWSEHGTGDCCGFDSAIWSGPVGSPSRVVSERDSAADPENPYLEFEGLTTGYLINASGETAFRAQIWGLGSSYQNSLSIWTTSEGTLRRHVRSDDPAPGTDAVFDAYIFGQSFAFNNNGQIAFLNRLTGPTINDSNDFGIWATDANGLLQLIAREGDVFDVNDDPLIDDLRTIATVGLSYSSNGEDGRQTYFNDAGQLAFWLRFTDNTDGIFVATIPEPGTITLFAVATGYVLNRRRRFTP